MKPILSLLFATIISSVFGQMNTKTIKSCSIFQFDIVKPLDSLLIYSQELDKNGNKLSEYDLQKKQTWEYDTNGRLISHITIYQNESNNSLTIYYNENGQKTKEITQSIDKSKINSDTTSYLYKKNNLIRESRNFSHHKESNDNFTVYHYDQNDSLVEETKYKSDSTIILKFLFKYSTKGILTSSYYFNSDATLAGDTTSGVTYQYDINDNLIKSITKQKFTHIRNNTAHIKTCTIQYKNNKKLEEVNYYNDSCITSIKKYDTNGIILKELIFWNCDTAKIEYERAYKNDILISDTHYHSDGGINSKKTYNNLGNLTESIEHIFELNGHGAIRYVNEYDKKNRFIKQLYFVKELPKDSKWDKISNVTSEWKNEKPTSSIERFYNTKGDIDKIIFLDNDNRIIKTQLFCYKYY